MAAVYGERTIVAQVGSLTIDIPPILTVIQINIFMLEAKQPRIVAKKLRIDGNIFLKTHSISRIPKIISTQLWVIPTINCSFIIDL